MQKLMRTIVGSNNVDAIDHAEQAASEEALTAGLRLAAATNSRKDLGAADVILVVGANLTESDPVLALDVIKALRGGKTVIVVDPRTTELASKATVHLAVKPGTDLAALRALMRHILDLGLKDAEFVAGRTEGFAAFEKSLAGVDMEAEALACGVDAGPLAHRGAAFGQAGAAAIMYGPGVTQAPQAVATVAALADLAMLTGNVGRPGTGLYPLRSGANSQGLSDMGVRPTAPVFRWRTMLDGRRNPVDIGVGGRVYVVGADPALALGDERRVRKALDRVEFLVVEDSFLTDTAQYADIGLPAAVAFEDDGTFTNAERFVQRVRPAVPSLGESLPDWKIVRRCGRRPRWRLVVYFARRCDA